MKRILDPVAPGELLEEEFLKPMGISHQELAKAIGVSLPLIRSILAGQSAVTAEVDLRLCRFLGLSNGYWLRAQAAYDTEVAQDKLSDVLEKITPGRQARPSTLRSEPHTQSKRNRMDKIFRIYKMMLFPTTILSIVKILFILSKAVRSSSTSTSSRTPP